LSLRVQFRLLILAKSLALAKYIIAEHPVYI